LADHLLGDWDRHATWWRWAAFGEQQDRLASGATRPRSALVRYDGFVTGLFGKVSEAGHLRSRLSAVAGFTGTVAS
jgi:hypothetical protein